MARKRYGATCGPPATLYKVYDPGAGGRRPQGPALARPPPHRSRPGRPAGATLAELMGRLGHTTPGAALRYQHAAQGRDAEIARRLSALVDQKAPEG